MHPVYIMHDYEMSIISMISKDSLLRTLNRQFDQFVVIQEEDHLVNHLIISFQKLGAREKFGVGLSLSNIGTDLQVAGVPYQNLCILGHNQTISIVDINKRCIVSSHTFVTPLVCFRCFQKCILVITEDGFFVLSYSGELHSSYLLDDLLVSYSLSDDSITFSIDSSITNKSVSFYELGIDSFS